MIGVVVASQWRKSGIQSMIWKLLGKRKFWKPNRPHVDKQLFKFTL